MNQREHEIERMKLGRTELLSTLLELLPEDDTREAIPGVFIARSSGRRESCVVSDPAFCFVVQGRKSATLGDDVYWYDPGRYLIFTVDLPLVFRIEQPAPGEPYLGLSIKLDPKLVASVMMDASGAAQTGRSTVAAIQATSIDADLLDVVVRLARLITRPDEVRVMRPMLMKELVFRLIAAGQASRLAQMLTQTGETSRISKAVGMLRSQFNQPLRIESLAREIGMSVSGFHHHFKAVTSMSPLQFQKQIRLQEARRMMLGEDLDAASAGFRVGYDDPAYFSREYKKLFGEPPQRDIARIRGALAANA